MTEFFAICDYFRITPQEFFDDGKDNPVITAEVIRKIEGMSEENIIFILSVINKISNTK